MLIPKHLNSGVASGENIRSYNKLYTNNLEGFISYTLHVVPLLALERVRFDLCQALQGLCSFKLSVLMSNAHSHPILQTPSQKDTVQESQDMTKSEVLRTYVDGK